MITADAALPHDLALERLVLGQAIACAQWSIIAAAGVEQGDFARVAHQQIWESAAAVGARGEVVDLVSVWMELRDRGWLDEVGQPYYNGLTSDAVRADPSTLTSVARRLRDLATTRRAIQAVRALESDLRDRPSEPGEVLGEGVPTLVGVGLASQVGEGTLAVEGQLAALAQESLRGARQRLCLGLPTLDNLLGGVHPGEVVGFMARPGVGKTLVLGHITRYLAEGEIGTFFASLEMPAAQIVERLARGLYELDRWRLMHALRDGSLDRHRYVAAFHALAINADPGLSVAQIEARVRRAQAAELATSGVSVVIVDHLGLVGGDRTLSTYDRVSLHARELKDLAKRLHVVVILAIQVSREAGGADGSRELTLGSARDSGCVEEAVDYLVGMRRLDRAAHLGAADREQYRDVIFLRAVKNRHGGLGDEWAVRMETASLALFEETASPPAADVPSQAALRWRSR